MLVDVLRWALEADSAAANGGIGGGCNDPPPVVIGVRPAGGRHLGEGSDVQRFHLVVGGRGAPPNGRGSDRRFRRELGSAAAVKAAVIGDTTATALVVVIVARAGAAFVQGEGRFRSKCPLPCFRTNARDLALARTAVDIRGRPLGR